MSEGVSRRVVRAALGVAVLLGLASCADDDRPEGSARSATSTAGALALPGEPPSCAGAARPATEEGRRATWALAVTRLQGDPAAPVWVGFRRTLSVEEAARLPGDLVASGVQLVFEQRQGTFVKALDGFDPVPVEDPAVAERAGLVLASAVGPPPTFPGVAPDAFDPVDPAVMAGAAPIAGLRVSGDVAAVVAAEGCLVFSLAPGDSPTGPDVSPAIEPDPVRLDQG